MTDLEKALKDALVAFVQDCRCTREKPCPLCKPAFAALELSRREGTCTVPPPGWRCTRTPGHEGPCAAYPTEGTAP